MPCAVNKPLPQLNLFERAPDDANVQWLERLLKDAACWMSMKEVALTAGGRVGDREVRALASASSKIISGQNGYKWIGAATPEEIHHASAWLISQGKKMIRRGIALKRSGHHTIG